MDVQRVAGLWNTLMTDNLGYRALRRGRRHWRRVNRGWDTPMRHLYGIHLTSITRPTPYLGPDATPSPGPSRRSSTNGAVAAGGGRATPIFRAPSPDPGLRAQRLPGRTRRLDCGEIRTWSDCHATWNQIHQGRTADHRDHVLVTQTISSSTRCIWRTAQAVVMGKDEKVPAPRAWPCFPGNRRPPREWGRAVVAIFCAGKRCQRRPLPPWKKPSCWRRRSALLPPVSIMCHHWACSAGKSTRGAGVVAPVGLWHVRYFSASAQLSQLHYAQRPLERHESLLCCE